MTSRRFVAVALLALPAVILGGCASGAGGASTGADASKVTIVTSTSVYADITKSLVGDAATVTAIIDSPSQDPHSYEATARDRLTVNGADLVVLNGGGYDHFMEDIAAEAKVPTIITAVEYAHDYPGTTVAEDAHSEEEHADEEHADEHGHDHIEGFNEHVWYDPHTMEHLVEAIAAETEKLLPKSADSIAAAQKKLVDGIAALETDLEAIGTAHPGATSFMTEPIGGYLAAAAGIEDVTTDGFAEAVEAGQDVAPATMLAALDALKAGKISVLITNAQTAGAESQQVIDAAKAAKVPVVSLTETLPAGQDYLGWMKSNITALSAALTA